MTSVGEEPARIVATKKRAQRACEMCRRRKRRCDGAERCNFCVKKNVTCTYNVEQPPAPAPKFLPMYTGVSYELNTAYMPAGTITAQAVPEKREPDPNPGLPIMINAIHGLNTHTPEAHPDDQALADIDTRFQTFSLNPGFHGKSSDAMLLKAAVDFKAGEKSSPRRRFPFDWPAPVPPAIKSWKDSNAFIAYRFPPEDLLVSLVSLYFDSVNNFLPLIHRPTFERSLSSHLHRTDIGFAQTLLLVCGLGARYAPGPRVSAGWEWFEQVRLYAEPRQTYPTLYDVQAYCLAATFLHCTSDPRLSWQVVGFGMRMAQDLGLHLHLIKSPGRALTLDQELANRATWMGLLSDAQVGAALGREISLTSDFTAADMHIPAICDDEYWSSQTDPPVFLTQPSDKPPVTAFFNSMLRLNRILGLTCRTLYATRRKRAHLGLEGGGWQAQVVCELDGALNTWFESVPAHLRWDPDALNEDDIFFDQSAALYCTYYHTRILIHRPFIHRPFVPVLRRGADPSHFQSLAICNTAARACSRVAEIQQRRRPNNPLWFSQTALFTSAVVLLLNIWGGFGAAANRVKDHADVRRCMTVLSAQQEQWPAAGAFLATLNQLVGVDQPREDSSRKGASGGSVSSSTDSRNESLPIMSPHTPEMSSHASPPHQEIASMPEDSDFTVYMDGDVHGCVDDQTLALWTQAPASFGVTDWETYLESFLVGNGGLGGVP
ncbi:fungal-specific transcription factor domain-containing protein [Mycena maculata]|uniref:Fungal-specific transcription factor domain-containing protein n=1 Tax=Mycena maculata TaxID=230809 RepID=A0AAD7IZX8_9AGAR|nr:fungal-specific transcription factor domain-containing protein [Mycena maculata]